MKPPGAVFRVSTIARPCRSYHERRASLEARNANLETVLMSGTPAVAMAAATGDIAPAPVKVDDQNQTIDPRIAYTVPNAAEALDIGESSVWKLIREGRIRSFKVFDRRLIPRAELQRFVSEAA
jgi:excisionase family DNA binding protein